MSKIVQAINVMIANPELITNVLSGDGEFFFLYKGKYKWGITQREQKLFLWFYPGKESLEELESLSHMGAWEGVDMVKYVDAEIGTREAIASFSELYTLIKEKRYGVQEMLEDIISDVDF
ncbi:MAG: hypothetical protein WAO71_13400 [Gallionella sp.]